MKVHFRLLALLSVVALSTSTAPAQTGTETRVSIAHPGFDSLKKDLSDILRLCTPAEQEQIVAITDYLDSFSAGLHQETSIRGVFPLNTTPFSFIADFTLDAGEPLFDNFRTNLEGLGYELDRDSKDATLYSCDADPEFLWIQLNATTRSILLQYAQDDATAKAKEAGTPLNKYKQTLLQDLRATLLRTSRPTIEVAGNLAAEILNDNITPEAQKARREAFAVSRKSSMDRVTQRPEESASEFAIRSRTASNLLDELERLFADVARATAVLTLDVSTPEAMTAHVSTTSKAIEGSELAGSVALFGSQPDAFATVPKAEGSALSIRVNHPVDPMRKANFSEFLSLVQKDLSARIAESKELSADEQAASIKVVEGVLGVVTDSVLSGYLNVFVEAVPDGQGDFVSVSAFSSPSAAKLNDVLPLLANAGKGNVVEASMATEGNVLIHRVQLATGYSDFMDESFGKEKDIYVGVSPTHVWLASGPGSLERLKATIAALGAPAASDTPVHVEVRLLPWIQKVDRLAKQKPEGTTPEEKEAQRDLARKRARAIAALADNDDVTADFKVRDGVVLGELKFGTGFLRMIGKEMAAFSKDNLE